MDELAPGLFRWTARHPEREADAARDSRADWPELVGSVLYDAPEATVFVDPLVPEELWPALDSHVESRRQPVVVVTTIQWHGRSRDEVLARYDGSEDATAGVA